MKHKSTITLYNKLSDMVGNLAELVEIQELTDTVILQVCGYLYAPVIIQNLVNGNSFCEKNVVYI